MQAGFDGRPKARSRLAACCLLRLHADMHASPFVAAGMMTGVALLSTRASGQEPASARRMLVPGEPDTPSYWADRPAIPVAAQPQTEPGPKVSVAPVPLALEEVSYRGPLFAWYTVALVSTWAPYALIRDCTGWDCMAMALPPLIRLGTAWGPPIVHWNRSRIGRGFLSLGGQIAAVIAGAAAGDALLPEGRAFDGWFIADVVWAATDIMLTPATIAVEAEPEVAALVPSIGWARGGARIDLRGAF